MASRRRLLGLALAPVFLSAHDDEGDPGLNRVLSPKVFRGSLMPIISPKGEGTYSRPIIYLVYTLSVLNQDARDALFEPTDLRYGNSSLYHYVGIGAEWWFQSSYQ